MNKMLVLLLKPRLKRLQSWLNLTRVSLTVMKQARCGVVIILEFLNKFYKNIIISILELPNNI
jgi:hypothetical protein